MSARISIVMPCYDCAAHVAASIDSVLAQTWTDWELVVVDDGSTDASAALVAAMDDPRIRLIRQANAGVSAARNRALDESSGELVAFLDADDTWAPTFLVRMLTALDAQTNAVLAYCGWQNIGLPGQRGEPFIPPDYETPAKLETLLGGCRWPIHAALTRRAAIMAAGGFNPHYANAEDYALWLQVATVAPIARVGEVLAFYHFHGAAQASANLARAALQLWQAQREFLASHPQAVNQLGHNQAAMLSHGTLMQRGFERYWARDIESARRIFRVVMRHGYGAPHQW
ncbi:MAG: glycosyltransferase, partial [Sulfuriferula sp.]